MHPISWHYTMNSESNLWDAVVYTPRYLSLSAHDIFPLFSVVIHSHFTLHRAPMRRQVDFLTLIDIITILIPFHTQTAATEVWILRGGGSSSHFRDLGFVARYNFQSLSCLSSSSHHMEKTEAGLKGLCIREIMTEYTLYYTKYYTIILRFPMPWRSAL